MRCREAKLIYPNHRLPPWPNEGAAPRSLEPLVRQSFVNEVLFPTCPSTYHSLGKSNHPRELAIPTLGVEMSALEHDSLGTALPSSLTPNGSFGVKHGLKTLQQQELMRPS